MSRYFGAIAQNGYAVRDLRPAMDHWINVLGVGPWFFVERVKTDYFRHRGKDSNVEMSIALANSGQLQFDFNLHSLRRITYVGVTFRTRSAAEVEDVVARAARVLGPALVDGRLRLPIDKVFPLEDAAAAFERMTRNEHFGKIVLAGA